VLYGLLETRLWFPQFPNEDVFFYTKHISNAHVLRETDPAAAQRALLEADRIDLCAVIGRDRATVPDVLYVLSCRLNKWKRLKALRQERARLDLRSGPRC